MKNNIKKIGSKKKFLNKNKTKEEEETVVTARKNTEIIIQSLKIVLLYTIICGILYPILITFISAVRGSFLLT